MRNGIFERNEMNAWIGGCQQQSDNFSFHSHQRAADNHTEIGAEITHMEQQILGGGNPGQSLKTQQSPISYI
jgi:hypothetical protein